MASRFIAYSFYGLLLLTLFSCAGYQNPPGRWVPIKTPSIYFSGVDLAADAVTSGYRDTCVEAQQEIEKKLIKRLPAQITPLKLYTAESPPAQVSQAQSSKAQTSQAAELKITISQCDIDVDQSGGSFTFYLSLPIHISLTEGDQILLDTSMKTYEQVQIDTPTPIFEFTFAEPVARTLMLFKGQQVWISDGSVR